MRTTRVRRPAPWWCRRRGRRWRWATWRRPTTARRDRLRVTDIYQVLAYTLFDRSDAHRIDALGIYSARYGLLVTWPLADMLATLAGQPVDLQAAREHVWRLLGG